MGILRIPSDPRAMVTIAGQPFKFQNVPPEDVFPTIGFMSTMTHFEKFLEIFLANRSIQELPAKLVHDRVISNNNIHDWIKFSAPPLLLALVCVKQSAGTNSISHRYREMLRACVEAATQEVQQKPFGEVVKYIVKAAHIINQVVNESTTKHPGFHTSTMPSWMRVWPRKA